jgi:hypothetical protein
VRVYANCRLRRIWLVSFHHVAEPRRRCANG